MAKRGPGRPRKRRATLFPPAKKQPSRHDIPLTAFYEQCDDPLRDGNSEYVPSYRWWVSNNPGDVFDIITKAQLTERIEAARALGIRTVDHLPGFCDKDCPDHKGWT